LDEAQRILGAGSDSDAVNIALREVVRREQVDAFFTDMALKDPQELERMREEAWQESPGS